MHLYFITGNKGKFEEMHAVISVLEQVNIDLPEIQGIDPHKIIQAKLIAAFEHHQGEFLVEDTSLDFKCLNSLPGPLIKWFLHALGLEGLAELTRRYGNNRAVARTIIGYARTPKDIHFFEGTIEGSIVPPRGTGGIGWDPIFQPDGHEKTFAEMTFDERNTVKMRRIAAEKLKQYLASNIPA